MRLAVIVCVGGKTWQRVMWDVAVTNDFALSSCDNNAFEVCTWEFHEIAFQAENDEQCAPLFTPHYNNCC